MQLLNYIISFKIYIKPKILNLQKLGRKVQDVPENLTINLYLHKYEDDLLPMPVLEGDEEVKLEAEETITEIVKLNPRIKNMK